MTSLEFNSSGKILWADSSSWPKVDKSKFKVTTGKTYHFLNRTPYRIEVDRAEIISEKGHQARILYYNWSDQSLVFTFDQEKVLGGRIDLILSQPTYEVTSGVSRSNHLNQLFSVRF